MAQACAGTTDTRMKIFHTNLVLPCDQHWPKHFTWIFSLNVTTLRSRNYYYSHFTNQETEIKYLSQSNLERGRDQIYIRVLKFQPGGKCCLRQVAHWLIEQDVCVV